jgi:hypothetical protein
LSIEVLYLVFVPQELVLTHHEHAFEKWVWETSEGNTVSETKPTDQLMYLPQFDHETLFSGTGASRAITA